MAQRNSKLKQSSIDSIAVQKILEESFPELAHLSVEFVDGGTDNWVYRLGHNLVIRLPRTNSSDEQNRKEQIWLNRLAVGLPLPIPRVVAGVAHSKLLGYGCYISSWVDGVTGTGRPELDTDENAVALGHWIEALRKHDTEDAPRPGIHNFFRGNSLRERDARTRLALKSLPGRYSKRTALRIWDEALEAVPEQLSETWIHGDLQPSNVILRTRQLAGIIDFGGLAVGDPACDLMACWTIFGASQRTAMRQVLNPDEASWRRGKGWALTTSIVAFDYYRSRSRAMTRQSLQTLHHLLAPVRVVARIRQT